MPEPVAADLSLLEHPVTASNLRLTIAPAMVRFALRARDPALLSSVIGRPVPARIGDVEDGVACLGPDEWLALLPAGTELDTGSGKPVSVVDVSSRSVGIKIEGPGAVALVATGCPLDVERMEVGRATRTVFETVEIVLWRTAPDAFHIEVWRSFAPWLCAALMSAISL